MSKVIEFPTKDAAIKAKSRALKEDLKKSGVDVSVSEKQTPSDEFLDLFLAQLDHTVAEVIRSSVKTIPAQDRTVATHAILSILARHIAATMTTLLTNDLDADRCLFLFNHKLNNYIKSGEIYEKLD